MTKNKKVVFPVYIFNYFLYSGVFWLTLYIPDYTWLYELTLLRLVIKVTQNIKCLVGGHYD